MGNIQSHKDLKVWQDAMNAAMEIYSITGTFPAEEKYSLVEQIRRSSRSVAANLAEPGAGAGTKRHSRAS